MRPKLSALAALLVAALLLLPSCIVNTSDPSANPQVNVTETAPGASASVSPSPSASVSSSPSASPSASAGSEGELDLSGIAEFAGEPFISLGETSALEAEAAETLAALEAGESISFESYSPLDSLGRCGVTFACIGTDLMPTEERGEIGQVKPSGWQTVRYDMVDGKYLYNRCHLIGFQLTGENANEQNLITGTRYMNVDGMLPFENMVADYIKETSNHVLYRVTPVFDGDDLVARGVRMEAISVEDGGEGILFDVFVYNCQPGIEIDYATGESRLADGFSPSASPSASPSSAPSSPSATPAPGVDAGTAAADYIVNTSSGKFHLPDCLSAAKIAEDNRLEFSGSRDELIAQGYSPCGNCDP